MKWLALGVLLMAGCPPPEPEGVHNGMRCPIGYVWVAGAYDRWFCAVSPVPPPQPRQE